MSIRIFYDSNGFRLRDFGKVRAIIEKVIVEESRIPGDLSFIFTDDETLWGINVEFMKQDYYTDVITFDYNIADQINGEIYISIDRVKSNAVTYNVSLKCEVLRVMMHGMLHLLGYNDTNNEERIKIREREDVLLEYFGFLRE